MAKLSSYKIKHNAEDLNSDTVHTFPSRTIVQNSLVTHRAYNYDVHSPPAINQLTVVYLCSGHWFKWFNNCEIFSNSLGRISYFLFCFPLHLTHLSMWVLILVYYNSWLISQSDYKCFEGRAHGSFFNPVVPRTVSDLQAGGINQGSLTLPHGRLPGNSN